MSISEELDESGLLKLQEEFLQTKSQRKPTVHLKSLKKPSLTPHPNRPLEEIPVAENHPVVGEVVEKSFGAEFKFEFKPKLASTVSFPVAQHRSTETSAQAEVDEEFQTPAESVFTKDVSNLMEEIHKENEQKLANMTETEILATRNQLLAKLDPSVIAFLKSRKKETKVDRQLQAAVRPQEETEDSAVAYLIPNLSQSWLHMDTVEMDKLQWTSPIGERTELQNELISARFDLEGRLMPVNSDISVAAGLHHHGKEESRPGYTVDELLPMCRSATLNQRLLALSVLAKICHLAKIGVYDTVLKDPVLQKLLEMGILTIIRLEMDQPGLNEVTGAIHLLYTMLYQPYDEALLDKSFNWFGGCLMRCLRPTGRAAMDTEESGTEVTDEELIAVDVVQGLIKMELLRRMRYVLEVLKPPEPTISELLKILIRLARHSPEVCLQIVECPRLLDVLQSYLTFDYKTCGRSQLVVKLIRLLSSSNNRVAELMMSKCEILDFVARWIITEDCSEANPEDFCCLVIECYRILSVLGWYGHGLDILSDLFPVLIKQLMLTCSSTVDFGKPVVQFMMERSSCLIRVINTAVIKNPWGEPGCLLGYGECVEIITCQLLQAWRSFDAKPPQGSFTDLLTVCFECLTAFYNRQLVLKGSDSLKSLISTEGTSLCKAYGSLLEECSLLKLAQAFTDNRDPVSLPSVQSTIKNAAGLCPSMTGTFSPFPLLTSFTGLLQSLDLTDFGCLLKSPMISNYFDSLNRPISELHNVSHFSLRHELYFLYRISLLIFKTHSTVPPTSVVLISLLSQGDANLAFELLREIVRFTTTTHECLPEDQLQRLNSLFIDTGLLGTNTSLMGSNLPLMENSWLFSPIKAVRHQFESQAPSTDAISELATEQIEIVRLNLGFIVRLLTQQPSLLGNFVNITSLYVSTAEVFLFGRDTFLDPLISGYLLSCLKILASRLSLGSSTFDDSCLEAPVFYDFYKTLLEEFEATSFGDYVFSQYLILPLFCDTLGKKCRSMIWSTERTAIYLIKLQRETLVIPHNLIPRIGTREHFSAAIKNKQISKLRNDLFFDLISATLSETDGQTQRQTKS